MKSLTIIIPTYNEEKNISNCLESIYTQNFPKNKLQVIVIDASTDKTPIIAKSFGAQVVNCKLPNEELKKPVAIKKYAKNEIIGFLDADNIIPSNDKNWLKKMVQPFDDPEIYASDTLYYTFRPEDNLITQYGAMIGGDDPIASYLGINDRYCYYTSTWTKAPHKEEDKGDYLKVTLTKENIPSLGSNGFFFRKKLYKLLPNQKIFIHPVVVYELSKLGYLTIAKVKQGIIHAQSGDIRKFFKKKLRRMQRRESGEIKWEYNYNLSKLDLIKTGLYVGLFLPVALDSFIGFIKKPSKAWLFHPFASWAILWLYAYYVLTKKASLD